MTKSRAKIRPHSVAGAASCLDGRTRTGRRYKQTINDLIEHIGGDPSATQVLLIEMIAQKVLRLEAIFEMTMADPDGAAPTRDKFWSWLASSLRRDLQALGIEPHVAPPPTLSEHLAGRATLTR